MAMFLKRAGSWVKTPTRSSSRPYKTIENLTHWNFLVDTWPYLEACIASLRVRITPEVTADSYCKIALLSSGKIT